MEDGKGREKNVIFPTYFNPINEQDGLPQPVTVSKILPTRFGSVQDQKPVPRLRVLSPLRIYPKTQFEVCGAYTPHTSNWVFGHAVSTL